MPDLQIFEPRVYLFVVTPVVKNQQAKMKGKMNETREPDDS